MSIEERKRQILEFIKRLTLAVVATKDSSGHPQAAVIEFSQTDDLEIIFDMFTTHRKYQNLHHDPRVALVIGWDNDVTVQYHGEARELSGKELERCKNIHLAKLPKAEKFVGMEATRFFKVIPTWIRYSDLHVNPWKVFEVTFKPLG